MQSREKSQGAPDRKFMYNKQQAASLGTNGPGYRIITMKTGPHTVGVQVGQALRMQSGEYITILKKNGFSWNQDQSCWSGPHENLQTVKNLLMEELKKFDLTRNYIDIPPFVNRYLTPMPRDFLFKSKMMDCQTEGLKIRYEDPASFSLEHTPLDLRTRLYEFQKAGINFSIKNNGRVLIGDEMGVGKTIQALGVASVYFKEWPVLILCPSSLKYNWRRETLEWLKSLITEEEHIQVIWKGSEKLSTTAKVIICSYDLAKSKTLAGEIAFKRFQVVICDEAHNLKSVTSERSRQLIPIIQRAKRVIMLTGTPAFARPVELYPVLAAIRPDSFSSFDEFGNRYGEPQKNPWANKWEYKGSSCVPELHYVLKQIMIRRLKRDVLSELPAKHRQVVEIPGKKETISQIKALTKKIEQQGKNLYSAVEQMMNASGAGGQVSSSAHRNDSEEKMESTQILMTQIYTLSSEAKIEGVLEFVNELEGYEMKLIIFAYHQTMLDALHEEAKKKKIGSIRIDGKTPAEDRGILVQNFQTNPAIRWAILSITAASVGLTLTASNVVIFAELYWTPAIIFQAEDRAHRISQTSAVTCYYLLAKDTIDQAMFDMIQKKSNLTNQLLDGGEADELTFTNAAHPSRSSKPLTIMDHFGSKAHLASKVPSFKDAFTNRGSQIVAEKFSLSKENLEELEELESQIMPEAKGSSNQSKPPVGTEEPSDIVCEDVEPLTKPVQTRTMAVNHHKVDAFEPEGSQKEGLGSPWSPNNQPDASWAEDAEDSHSS